MKIASSGRAPNPVDARRFNVYTTSIRRQRRRIDVETTSCVYWVIERSITVHSCSECDTKFQVNIASV